MSRSERRGVNKPTFMKLAVSKNRGLLSLSRGFSTAIERVEIVREGCWNEDLHGGAVRQTVESRSVSVSVKLEWRWMIKRLENQMGRWVLRELPKAVTVCNGR